MVTATAHPGRPAHHDGRAASLDLPLSAGLGLRLIDDDAPERGVWFVVNTLAANVGGGLHPAALGAAMELAAHLALGPDLAFDERAVTQASAHQITHDVALGARLEVTATLYRPERHTAYLYADVRAAGVLVATGQLIMAITRAA